MCDKMHLLTPLSLFLFITLCFSQFPIDELRNNLQDGFLLTPQDPLYNSTIKIDNAQYQRFPKVIVLPKSLHDIRVTISFAKKYNTKFTVKGGGHSAAGYCLNDDIVMDMRFFNTTKMLTSDIAIIGAGSTWGNVYDQLKPNIPIGGTCKGVGVIGYTLGGGVSLLTRSYGLMIDHVLEFTMVTADGEVKIVNETTDPDLFWALKGGGGGNFGIITSMKVRTIRTASEELLSGSLCWKMEQARNLIRYYNNEWIHKIPNQMAGYGAYFLSRKEFCILFLYTGEYSQGLKYVQPFLQMNPISNSLKKRSYVQLIHDIAGGTDVGNRFSYIKSGILHKGDLNEQVINIMDKYSRNTPSSHSIILWTHVGGKMSEISPSQTAFYHRNAYYMFEVKAIWERKEEEESNILWAENLFRELKPFLKGSYVNYIDPKLPNWQNEYFGSNYQRLVATKRRIDPQNFFTFEKAIDNEKNREKEMIRKMNAFQEAQENLNSAMLEPLFSDDIVTQIPLGTGYVKGKQQVLQDFQSFFNGVQSMKQERTSPFEINERFGGYSKKIHQVTKRGCHVHYTVMNWYEFDTHLKIKSFTALFNLTSVIEQSNCKP